MQASPIQVSVCPSLRGFSISYLVESLLLRIAIRVIWGIIPPWHSISILHLLKGVHNLASINSLPKSERRGCNSRERGHGLTLLHFLLRRCIGASIQKRESNFSNELLCNIRFHVAGYADSLGLVGRTWLQLHFSLVLLALGMEANLFFRCVDDQYRFNMQKVEEFGRRRGNFVEKIILPTNFFARPQNTHGEGFIDHYSSWVLAMPLSTKQTITLSERKQ